MPILKHVVAALFALALPLAVVACDDDHPEAEAFATLQGCFDDHQDGAESLPPAQAITVCCLEHPIAGVAPSCTDTEAGCVAHVESQLDGSVTPQEIQAACTDYINQK